MKLSKWLVASLGWSTSLDLANRTDDNNQVKMTLAKWLVASLGWSTSLDLGNRTDDNNQVILGTKRMSEIKVFCKRGDHTMLFPCSK